MNPICTNFFPSSTSASTTSSAASALSASGFSQSTGFSAFRHSSTSGAWVGSGEATTTASTFSSRISSAPSVKTAAESYCSAIFPALSASTSETAANLAFATLVWRFSACMPPMPPVPMTPTAICSDFPICSSFCSVDFGRGPSPAFHAPFDGVYDRLAAVAVLEGRPRARARLYPVEEVFDGVHEGVLVSDDVPRRPPPRHVRVLRLGDEERAETGSLRLLILEVRLQLVHPLQVEDQAPLRAVDLERLLRLAPRGQGARLEGPCGPVLEARQERRRVVHCHPIHLRVRAVRPFAWTLLDKGLGDAYHLRYGAHQEMREVHQMGAQIREGASSPGLLAKAPGHRSCGVEEPVLEVDGPPVTDLSQSSFVHEPLRELHRRYPPVVVADHAHRARTPGGLHHLPGLDEGVGERLLAEDVLSGLESGHGELVVGVAGRRNVHQLYVVALQHTRIVRLVALPAQSVGRGPDGFLVPAADGAHSRRGVHVEKARDLPVGVRVGPAHEPVAHESHADLAHTSASSHLLDIKALVGLLVGDLAVSGFSLQPDGPPVPVRPLGGPGEDSGGGVSPAGPGLRLAAYGADEVLHLLPVGVGETLDEVGDVVPVRPSGGERLRYLIFLIRSSGRIVHGVRASLMSVRFDHFLAPSGVCLSVLCCQSALMRS